MSGLSALPPRGRRRAGLVEAFFVSANVKPELLARTQAWHQQFAAGTLNMRCHSWCWTPYWEAPFGVVN